jgi:hypothetical protein
MVLFMLSILLVRVIWMLALNQTTIEGWEIERHKTLVRRARLYGGFLDGPNGTRIRIQRQEFPYDIGIWQNIREGMGGTNNVSLANFEPARGLTELSHCVYRHLPGSSLFPRRLPLPAV